MSRYKDGKEITLIYYGREAITAIYKGLKLVMQMGNFFTREGLLFVTKDDETFDVKDET
jgi:hypothetical protein